MIFRTISSSHEGINKVNLENLTAMLAWMEHCGKIGHFATFKVSTDGDGYARFEIIPETEEEKHYLKIAQNEIKQLKSDPDIFHFE